MNKIFLECPCGQEFDFQLTGIEYTVLYIPVLEGEMKRLINNPEGHLTVTVQCSICEREQKIEIYGLDNLQFPRDAMPEIKL